MRRKGQLVHHHEPTVQAETLSIDGGFRQRYGPHALDGMHKETRHGDIAVLVVAVVIFVVVGDVAVRLSVAQELPEMIVRSDPFDDRHNGRDSANEEPTAREYDYQGSAKDVHISLGKNTQNLLHFKSIVGQALFAFAFALLCANCEWIVFVRFLCEQHILLYFYDRAMGGFFKDNSVMNNTAFHHPHLVHTKNRKNIFFM